MSVTHPSGVPTLCATEIIGDMELAHIRYFLALCEVEQFTKAAQVCGVSQPTLSNSIRNLEKELGGVLFERKPPVQLSALGRSVRPHFEAIWRELMHVERMFRQSRESAAAATAGAPAPGADRRTTRGAVARARRAT